MSNNRMSGPFPGMDPFMELRWADIHAALIVYARNQLQPQLPQDLSARIEETLSVEEDGGVFLRKIVPDVRVTQEFHHPADNLPVTEGRGALAVAEPILFPVEPPRLRHLEIVDPAGRVITAIEFLSPWNKIGVKARRKYGQKQDELTRGGVNLVEIDLIRQGEHVALAPVELLPPDRRGTYLVSVYRQDDPQTIRAYPIKLRDRLPNIPIPLRSTDQDVVLQLQPLIDDCYRDARCDRTNYQQPLAPPLAAADAVWAESLLTQWKA
ncbi:MAG: DUF4058 family protein [Pirellulaceae bacterium]|nr:DUF4058 family protein [Pirellulaceae bacterium]